MKALEGRISISRPQGGEDGGTFVRVAIRDQSSRVEFVQLDIPLAGFAEALTGLSEVECRLKVRGLDRVGKVRETERVTFALSDDYLKKHSLSRYERELLVAHIRQDPEGIFHEEGWELSTYLGSQNSITPNHPDGIRINTTKVRYVERTEE